MSDLHMPIPDNEPRLRELKKWYRGKYPHVGAWLIDQWAVEAYREEAQSRERQDKQMKTRTLERVVNGEKGLRDVLHRLIRESRWFEVEPWPGDTWIVRVKDEPGARETLFGE